MRDKGYYRSLCGLRLGILLTLTMVVADALGQDIHFIYVAPTDTMTAHFAEGDIYGTNFGLEIEFLLTFLWTVGPHSGLIIL